MPVFTKAHATEMQGMRTISGLINKTKQKKNWCPLDNPVLTQRLVTILDDSTVTGQLGTHNTSREKALRRLLHEALTWATF